MNINLEKELELAKDTALEAGELLHLGVDMGIMSNYGKDIKTKLDLELENEILSKLDCSGYNIITEETGEIDRKSDYTWVIDPIDGTFNLSRGIPYFSISIGLLKGFKPILGVIYDVGHKDLYSGIIGKGAWMNNNPMHVSDVDQKNQAALCTGIPKHSDFSQKNLENFFKNVRDFKQFRCIGCASLAVAAVASGKVEAYYENGIMLWDVAAGLALVESAGGKIEYTYLRNPNKKFQYEVFASNGKIEL
jgi:myo-inositol-1(or 4)-monophosphatase